MKRIDESNAHLHQDGFIGRANQTDPKVHHGFYIRPMRVDPGKPHDGHSHHVDHVMVIKTVPAQIDYFNPETGERDCVLVTVPCKLPVLAEVWHKITAIEGPVEWECWFWDTPEAAAGVERG